MYITVKLLNGFKESLTYRVPDSWPTHDLEGMIVKVPLQKRFEYAYIEKSFTHLPSRVNFVIKDVLDKDFIPLDPAYLPFLKKLSHYYARDVFTFLRRLKKFLQEKEHTHPLAPAPDASETKRTVLTADQQIIVDTITPHITQGTYYPALIHGVTNSGKTEVYKHLMLHAWSEGKTSILLFPEVSLAVQFARLLRHQLPHIDIFSFHSSTSITEKKALWHHLFTQKPAILIGVHLPLLVPISKLGLIIIDEEHDVGYQEKHHPKIHTKEAALIRAQCSSIPLIAGSATPSIASLYNVKHKGWHFFQLHHRFAGSFPKISVVHLTHKKPRKNFFISTELEEAITKQLQKKEQTIIFLNRRGYSFFIQCKECGSIPHCINCSVSLTLHKDGSLRCHYCSYTLPELTHCQSCSKNAFIKKGIGTQQVVSILEKLFPQARIARADLDTTIDNKKWARIMQDFEKGELDILVGTQTITKGYHFPKVTLVGIIWADINLGIPLYNAAEITLQQLIQVAGRAGRQSQESTVIVQTMIDHQIFNYLNEESYMNFYHNEVAKRAEVQYPPCTRFAEIELKHTDESVLIKEAEALGAHLKKTAEQLNKKLTILGPTQPPVSKIQKLHCRKIYIKADTLSAIIDTYTALNRKNLKSLCFFTPNPLS